MAVQSRTSLRSDAESALSFLASQDSFSLVKTVLHGSWGTEPIKNGKAYTHAIIHEAIQFIYFLGTRSADGAGIAVIYSEYAEIIYSFSSYSLSLSHSL